MTDQRPENDEEFLTLCDLPPHPHALRIALAVRRTIASFADVNPQMIHAGDRIPDDLGDIFIYESPIAVEFIMVLEQELNTRLPDFVTDILCKETVTVKEIVSEINRLVSGQL
jgi:hypothetical protein